MRHLSILAIDTNVNLSQIRDKLATIDTQTQIDRETDHA
ncbi:hypothetical protein O23A_p4453 [Aeromonas salmonicida]|nr:hypothetical protein O23A_p4453 [Aeromonas salmonicida]